MIFLNKCTFSANVEGAGSDIMIGGLVSCSLLGISLAVWLLLLRLFVVLLLLNSCLFCCVLLVMLLCQLLFGIVAHVWTCLDHMHQMTCIVESKGLDSHQLLFLGCCQILSGL